MELFKQDNNFDCGICSLMMLLKHYKINHISKEQLYENTYIESSGISIMELELLAYKFGIFLDSYQASFKEIIDDKSLKTPFILVTNENDNLHYVVAIKEKDYIMIYDPKGIVKKVSFDSPLENYTDILIKSEKLSDSFKYKIFSKNNKFNFINKIYIVFNVSISLLALCINLFCSFIISQLINRISNNDLFIILAIVFGMIFFYISNSLLEYIIFRLRFKLLIKMYMLNLNYLMNKFKFKLPGFYQTIDKNIFNNSYQILKNNILFVNDFISNCIINSIFILSSIILIIFVEVQFLLLILVNTIIIFIFSLFEHKFNNQLAKINIEKNNKIQDLLIKINQFNSFNYSYKLNNLIFYKLKNKLKDIEYSRYKIDKKSIWISVIKNFWNSIFYLILILYYLSINKFNNIGNLFLCLQIISLLNKNSIELFDCISDSINFKIIKEMLSNLININNLKDDLNSQKITTNIKSNFATLIIKNNFNFNLDIKDEKLKIDNIPVSKINNFNDSCTYIKYETLNDLILYLFKKEIIFENEKLKEEYINFQKNKFLYEENKYTQIDYLILYLFYLSVQNKQIIIIDSNLELNIDNKQYNLINLLINEIKNNNYLFFVNSLIISEINYEIIDLNNEENL